MDTELNIILNFSWMLIHQIAALPTEDLTKQNNPFLVIIFTIYTYLPQDQLLPKE